MNDQIVGTLKRTEIELANMLDNSADFSPEWVEIMRNLHTQVRCALSDSKWGTSTLATRAGGKTDGN